MKLDATFLQEDAAAPAQRATVLRLGAFEPRSRVAGPGERAVVWVAGCRRRCPQCIKPQLLSFDAGGDVDVDAFAERILAIEGIDGVTYSGGEPFEHAAPLARLSRILKASGKTIVCYSGYTLDALREQPRRFQALLEMVDLLIAGEYRLDEPGPLPWRGSANQTFHLLTPTLRGRPLPSASAAGLDLRRGAGLLREEVQVTFSGSGLRLSGFPTAAMRAQFAAQLSARGIELQEMDGA